MHNQSIQNLGIPHIIQENVYRIVDSTAAAAALLTIMLIDFLFCLVFTLYLLLATSSSVLNVSYIVVDWITAIVFTADVIARLYSYGLRFYFHGPSRIAELLLSILNLVFIIAYAISSSPWLLIIRYLRLLRVLSSALGWRERQLMWKTRLQLESLARVLETSRADKLTKWKIEAEAIALGDRAGQGAFGTVFAGLFRGTLVAIKQISFIDTEQTMSSFEDEAITLVNLRHPNVVLFMGFVQEPEKLWILTEYCSRGSLRDVLDDGDHSLTEGRILKLALGAARGLAYLHGQDPPVLHLDLKTSNVLISSGWDAKLGDFGLSRSMDNIEKDWFSGTMQYAAPEILEANVFTTAADIYSFGICLWEMAAKELPFQGMSPTSVLWGVVKKSLRPSLAKLRCTSATGTGRGGPAARNGNSKVKGISKDGGTTSGSMTFSPKSSEDMVSQVRRADKVLSNDLDARIKDSHHERRLQRASPGATVRTTGRSLEDVRNENQPIKRRSVMTRAPVTGNASEGGSSLSNLTNKVTATIQMFDDRPPIVKKRGEDGSFDGMKGDGARESFGRNNSSDASGASYQKSVAARLKLSLISKRGGKQGGGQVEQTRSNSVGSASGGSFDGGEKSVIEDEGDPFMRRLATWRVTRQEGMGGSCVREWEDDEDDVVEGDAGNLVTKNLGDKKGWGKREEAAVQVPAEYVELIEKCWAQDPSERPSAGEIVWRLVILIDGQMREK